MPRPGFLFFILRSASETDMRAEASVSINFLRRGSGTAARHNDKTATDYLSACMPPHIPTPKVEKPADRLEAPRQEPPPASAHPFQDLSSRMKLFFPPLCRCPSLSRLHRRQTKYMPHKPGRVCGSDFCPANGRRAAVQYTFTGATQSKT